METFSNQREPERSNFGTDPFHHAHRARRAWLSRWVVKLALDLVGYLFDDLLIMPLDFHDFLIYQNVFL